MGNIKRHRKKLSQRQMKSIGLEYLTLLEREYVRRQRRRRLLVAAVIAACVAGLIGLVFG